MTIETTAAGKDVNGALWQPPTLYRVFGVIWSILAIVLTIWAVGVAVDEKGSFLGMLAFSIVVFLLPAGATTWFAFRCRLVETADGIDIRTMFGARHFAWEDIVEVAPDRSGVRLRLADGTTYLTGAMYGFEWRSLIGHPRRGVALADRIVERSGARLAEEATWYQLRDAEERSSRDRDASAGESGAVGV